MAETKEQKLQAAVAPAKELTAMDEDELSEEFQRLDDLMVGVRDAKRNLQLERDDRAIHEKAAALSDSERQALAQIISAEGIQSEEEAGTPGSKEE